MHVAYMCFRLVVSLSCRYAIFVAKHVVAVEQHAIRLEFLLFAVVVDLLHQLVREIVAGFRNAFGELRHPSFRMAREVCDGATTRR